MLFILAAARQTVVTMPKINHGNDMRSEAEPLLEELIRRVSGGLLARLTLGLFCAWLAQGLRQQGWLPAWLAHAVAIPALALVGWALLNMLRLGLERRRLQQRAPGEPVPWPQLPLLSAWRRRLGW